MRISPRIALFVCFSSMLLAACGGGPPQPALSNPPPAPPPAPPPPEPPPNEFDTDEFRRSWGLEEINPLAAYEAGGTGEGVTVAVIDSGIDRIHTDLKDQIHPASQDLIASRPNPTVQDQDGHGTFVSGIIAAERNTIGIHGVAFDAQILALRGDSEGTCAQEDGCTFNDFTIADGVQVAIDNGAKVINLSLGGDPPLSFLLDQFRAAAAAGLVIVISAGNDSAPDPTAFALSGLDPEILGSLIIVGAIDRFDQLASFSNRAGVASDIYVVAPGQDVRSTFLGGGTGIGSGTSFSAPFVAGAAAVLFDLFPNLSGKDVVDILLSTARDLGTIGVDSEFGHGLIDLGAAVQPQGTTTVASLAADGIATHPVSETLMLVAPALGDALRTSSLFDDVVMLDAYNRAYLIDLGARVLSSRADVPVLHNVFERSDQSFGAWGYGNARLRFSATGNDRGAAGFLDALAPAERAALQRQHTTALLDTHLGQRVSLAFGLGLATNAMLPAAAPGHSEPAFLWTHRDDHLALVSTDWRAGAGAGFSLNRQFRVGIAAATGVERDYFSGLLTPTGQYAPHVRAVQARLAFKSGPAAAEIDVGTLAEQGSFLGSRGSGGFATGGAARTYFARWLSSLELGANARLGMEYSIGTSTLQGSLNRFITGLDNLRTSSFRVSLERQALFSGNDRLAFAVAQPMRLESGRATAVLPVSMNFKTERLLFATRSASVASSGREIDFELVYEHPLFDSLVVRANLVHQRNPGHVFGAPPATSALVRLMGRF